MTRDEAKDRVKEAFARDPLPLIAALGLRVDDRKSKGGVGKAVWCFDGAEEEASLQIGGKSGMEGLCTRYGDDWHGDCFGLVQRYRPGMGFKQRLEFVAEVYGVQLPEGRPARRNGNGQSGQEVAAEHEYTVTIDGAVVAIHKRLDYQGGGKRMWWTGPDGENGLPEGLELTALPLWGAEALAEHPTRPVIVCEGEKDADALREEGLLAVGTYGADVVPEAEPLQALAGRKVYLWPDADAPGERHMRKVAEGLAALGAEALVIAWPEAPKGAGAADWFNSGKTVPELRLLAKQAKPWREALVAPEPVSDAEQSLAHLVNSAGAYEPPAGIAPGAQAVADLAGEIIEAVEDRRQLPPGIYGLRSGWPTVDKHFGGFRYQGLILLLGGSGVGKTTLARHFLFATCEHLKQVQSDAKVLFYALEGGLEQFLSYYGGYSYGVPFSCYMEGGTARTTDDIAERMMDAYASFANLPLMLSEESDGDRIMFDIERQVAEREVEAVILDNVQELTFGAGNEWRQNKRMATRVRDFCKETGIPFLALSQVNEFKGQASSPRGGPEWFQKATCVLAAVRGDTGMKREEALATNLTRLTNQKLRYTASGIMREVRLAMDLSTRRLYEQAAPGGPGGEPVSAEAPREWPNNG